MQKELLTLIQKNKAIFWDIAENKLEGLSNAAILERFLSYGEMDGIKELLDILGMNEARDIFNNELLTKRRPNLKPRTINYFKLYFDKYAS